MHSFGHSDVSELERTFLIHLGTSSLSQTHCISKGLVTDLFAQALDLGLLLAGFFMYSKLLYLLVVELSGCIEVHLCIIKVWLYKR
jgi:hypothetical protein